MEGGHNRPNLHSSRRKKDKFPFLPEEKVREVSESRVKRKRTAKKCERSRYEERSEKGEGRLVSQQLMADPQGGYMGKSCFTAVRPTFVKIASPLYP